MIFKTNLYGLIVDVECTLTRGEPAGQWYEGGADECEIHNITHEGFDIEFDELPDDQTDRIIDEAFKVEL